MYSSNVESGKCHNGTMHKSGLPPPGHVRVTCRRSMRWAPTAAEKQRSPHGDRQQQTFEPSLWQACEPLSHP